MKTSIRLVLFDLDETLIRHTATFENVFCETFAAFSTDLEPVTAGEFLQAFWPKMLDVWHMMVAGDLDGKAGRYHAFRNTLRLLEADESLARALCDAADAGLVASSKIAPGAIKTLGALRKSGLMLGVVTNGFDDLQRKKLDHHKLTQRTDFQLVSESERSHKPDGVIFARALERCGCPPEKALFVGDSLGNDINGALDAGMHAAHLSGGVPAREHDRYHAIHTLPDVIGVLERL